MSKSRLTVARLEYWARADTLFNVESDQVNGKTINHTNQYLRGFFIIRLIYEGNRIVS